MIANRGEITLRVMRSCREKWAYGPLLSFSETDRTSVMCDVCFGGAYLIGPAIARKAI